MARSKSVKDADSGREAVLWLQVAVLAGVVLVLAAVLWVLVTVRSVEAGPPRTATERQLRTLEAAVEAQPESARAWADLIGAQALAGQIHAAKDTVARADEALGGRRGAVAVEAARITFLEGDVRAALQEVDEALELVEQEIEAEAEKLAQRGITMQPDMSAKVDGLLLKAEILAATDDIQGAVAAYSEALEIEPQMADVLVERGLLYEKLGEIGKAGEDFTRALTFVPGYEPAREALERIGGRAADD